MLVVAVILVASFAIGVLMQGGSARDGGGGGMLWGVACFVISATVSLAAHLAKPYLFPAWLTVHPGLFERPLSTGEMVLSFFLNKIWDFGPCAAITVIFLVFAVGTKKGGRRRPAEVRRDWRSKL